MLLAAISKGPIIMKEIIVSENNKLEICETDIPQCGDDDVLVKVSYSGLCGSDIPRIFHDGAHFYPVRLGHEFSGTVIETGCKVTEVKPGDSVCCVPLVPDFSTEESQRGFYSLGKGYSFVGSRQPGGNAEYVVIPQSSCFPLPEDVDHLEGAFFEPVTVGIHPILMAGGCKDKNVIVLGVGTIGLLAMQSAKALGARSVTAVDINEFLQLIRFDQLILETAGVPHTVKLALKIAGPRAQLALIGTLHNDLSLSFKEYEQILRNEMTVIGSWMNYSKPFPGDEWRIAIELFRNKRIQITPLIDSIVNDTHFIDKVMSLKGGPANGKILLRWE